MSKNPIEEKIEDILFEEVMVYGYPDCTVDIEGRDEAVKRIMREVIEPILAGNQPTS